jgi:hypothetical protein
MDQQQPAATPVDAAPEQGQAQPRSLDDRILDAFGLGEPEESQETEEATPAPEGDDGEPEVEIPPEDVPQEPVGDFTLDLVHNGQKQTVKSREEAQRLAQMGYDYEFRMQRVHQDAQRVKAMDAAIQARASIQAQALDAMAEAKSYERALSQYANVDWDAENQHDPVGASQKWMQYSRLRDAYGAAQGRIQQLAQPYQQAAQQVDANWAALQEQKLLDRIPEWKDSNKRGQEGQAILQTLAKDYGFAQEELGGPLFYDHRVLSILRDAYKYRQATTNAPKRKGQLQGLPQTARPGAKPPPRSQAQSVGDVKRALSQTKDSGHRKVLTDELIARKFGLK